MMRCSDVALKSNLPEHGLHWLALDMAFNVAAVYCHRHNTQRLLVGVEGMLHISVGVAVAEVVVACGEDAAFDDFLLEQALEQQRVLAFAIGEAQTIRPARCSLLEVSAPDSTDGT